MCRPWCQSLLLPLPALWVWPGSSMTGAARACSRTTSTPSISMLPALLGRLPMQQARVRTRGSAQRACPSWLLSLPGTSGAALALHLTMSGPCSAPEYVRSLLVMPAYSSVTIMLPWAPGEGCNSLPAAGGVLPVATLI